MLYKAIHLNQCILTGIHPKWHFQFPTPWSAYGLCSFFFPRMSQLGPELLFPLVPAWVPALSPDRSLPQSWAHPGGQGEWNTPVGRPRSCDLLSRTPMSCSSCVRGGDNAMPQERGWEFSHCFHVLSVLGCTCVLSTQHFVLCRQNIHNTRLPFQSPVSSTHIKGRKVSCLKIGLEIPS